jgi:hypothetical protein
MSDCIEDKSFLVLVISRIGGLISFRYHGRPSELRTHCRIDLIDKHVNGVYGFKT